MSPNPGVFIMVWAGNYGVFIMVLYGIYGVFIVVWSGYFGICIVTMFNMVAMECLLWSGCCWLQTAEAGPSEGPGWTPEGKLTIDT